jgi:hypothetical protein
MRVLLEKFSGTQARHRFLLTPVTGHPRIPVSAAASPPNEATSVCLLVGYEMIETNCLYSK